MNLKKEDYMDPLCVLRGMPGEIASPQPIHLGRVMEKLRIYEDQNDWPAVEKHLIYWLAEAEANRDERGQLTLHNELMGFYRKQGQKEQAFLHAEKARELIHRVLLDKEREEVVEERRRDFKTELQELVQRRSDQVLRYELVGSSGPDHAKVFEACVTVNGQPVGSGTGRSKKEAEQAAARSALERLKK